MNDSPSISGVRLLISMAIAGTLAFALGYYRECSERHPDPEAIAFAAEVEWESD